MARGSKGKLFSPATLIMFMFAKVIDVLCIGQTDNLKLEWKKTNKIMGIDLYKR